MRDPIPLTVGNRQWLLRTVIYPVQDYPAPIAILEHDFVLPWLKTKEETQLIFAGRGWPSMEETLDAIYAAKKETFRIDRLILPGPLDKGKLLGIEIG